MKSRTMVNMLLITFILSALGCAQNEVVKKDEVIAPTVPQKRVEATKNAATQPATSADTSTTSNTDQTTGQIVPAVASDGIQKELAPAGVVYFGFDSYVLTTESGNILQENFNKLASKPSIKIEGHCDEQGSSEYNLSLGEKRAKAAQNYLITLGYPAARISTISFGKERPAAPGHDEVAWAKNRRDELRIVH